MEAKDGTQRKGVLARRGSDTGVSEGTPAGADEVTRREDLARGGWAALSRWLASPVSGASLGAFRIAFGIVMLLEAFTFFRPSFSSGGLSHLDVYYGGPGVRFHLPYVPEAWMAPLPRWVFVMAGWVLGVGAAGVALGFRHRWSAWLVLVSWGFLYWVESTRTYWMSYYWLELLVAMVLVWMPAANRWSLDARLRPAGSGAATVPRWTLALLRAQLVATYFYAGVAKLNADWLLDLMPVRWFLEQPHVLRRLQGCLGESVASRVAPWLLGTPGATFLSWAGAAFDVSVGFLLLHRRTRLLALGLTWLFHGINHFLLFQDIEWFPLLGATTATIFLEPDWPDRWVRWLRRPEWKGPDWRWALPGMVLLPGVGFLLGWRGRRAAVLEANGLGTPAALPAWGTAIVLGWVTIQGLVPLRHLLVAGDSRITFEGLSFSWRLKAELYQTHPAEITVADPGFRQVGSDGKVLLRWDAWPGPKVLHRAVERGHIDWSVLPRICVVTDVELGDRILFNPKGPGAPVRDEDEARAEVQRLWRTMHGRLPDGLHRAISAGALVDSYMRAAAQKGTRLRTRDEAMSMIRREHGRQGNGTMIPFLRRLHPFATGYDDASPLPFLWIEDGRLLAGQHPQVPRLQPDRWVTDVATRGTMDERRVDSGGDPVVLLVERPAHVPLPMDAPFTLWDVVTEPGRGPEVWWDGLSDAGTSKYMHISLNPFLLRRYAHRVAQAWKDWTRRDAAVHARTFVGLNRRPPQAVVDPAADLARVEAVRFGHSSWVRDLATKRIPAK